GARLGRRDVLGRAISGAEDPQTLRRTSGLILFVADLLHPVDEFSVQRLLNGDMRHRRCRRRAMPVLLTRREPDHIAGADLLDRTAPALRPPEAGYDDQGLTEGMGVPGGARARLERDVRAAHARRFG